MDESIIIIVVSADGFEARFEKLQSLFLHAFRDINFCGSQLRSVTAQGLFKVTDRITGYADENHILAIVFLKCQYVLWRISPNRQSQIVGARKGAYKVVVG